MSQENRGKRPRRNTRRKSSGAGHAQSGSQSGNQSGGDSNTLHMGGSSRYYQQGKGSSKRGNRDQRMPARGFWLYGQHASIEAVLNAKRRIHRIVTTENGLETLRSALDEAAGKGLGRPQPEVLKNSAFAETITDAPGHNGIAIDVAPLMQPDLPTVIEALPANAPACLIVLDQVTDPHNIGAIIRSAAAFGAVAVVAQDRNAPDETAVMTKIASGGSEHVPYVKVTNISRTLAWLEEHDFIAYALDERGDSILGDTKFTQRAALVMGAEGSGLRRLVAERCHHTISLPTLPPILSLNVSNAAAVTLYEWSRATAQQAEG